MTDRELMQQALEAFEYIYTKTEEDEDELIHAAINALRDRLAKPEQKPVVLMDAPLLLNGQPLYTTPPQRPWVGLTDDEILRLWAGDVPRPVLGKNKVLAFAHAIEAQLKQRNT